MKTYLVNVKIQGLIQQLIIRAESEEDIHYINNCASITSANRKEIIRAFVDRSSVVTIGLDPTPKSAEAKTVYNTIQEIKAIVDEAVYMKNAYFFNPPSKSSLRRYYEKKHTHDIVEWTEGGNLYSAAFDVKCTCTSVYAKGYYTKNGEQTNLKAIRYSLAKLQTALLLGEI